MNSRGVFSAQIIRQAAMRWSLHYKSDCEHDSVAEDYETPQIKTEIVTSSWKSIITPGIHTAVAIFFKIYEPLSYCQKYCFLMQSIINTDHNQKLIALTSKIMVSPITK